MQRYTVQWNTQGGAGTSTFHLGSATSVTPQAAANAIRTMFDSLKALLPTDVSISFPGEWSVINPSTGELTGVNAITAPSPVLGTGSSTYSAPTGGRIRWITDSIRHGRRVTGTTFIVPLLGTAFDGSGSLSPTVITTIDTAAGALLSAMGGSMVVWSKPSAAGGSDGAQAPVTGKSVPDLAAVLRSRRD